MMSECPSCGEIHDLIGVGDFHRAGELFHCDRCGALLAVIGDALVCAEIVWEVSRPRTFRFQSQFDSGSDE
jgi:hypothetical protein